MMTNKTLIIVVTAAWGGLLQAPPCDSFQPVANRIRQGGRVAISLSSVSSDAAPPQSISTRVVIDPKAIQLKDDLIAISTATRRGFSASRSDREKAKKIINDLSMYSPVDQPAAAYYKGGKENSKTDNCSTLAGKWTLVYTDAPDITSLDGGPLSTAKLGRIGQECSPPFIKNVIEWKKPDWASSLPFTGGESSRVLQKVCCQP